MNLCADRSKRGKQGRSATGERENPASSAALVAANTGLGLDGLLSQFSRFLMKKGESLAGAHVSCVVSGIAVDVV